MNARQLWIPLVALVLGGLAGLWYLLSNDAGEAATAARLAPITPAQAESDDAPAPAVRPAGGPQEPGSARAVLEPVGGPAAPARPAAQGSAAGGPSVVGRVVDTYGRPLAEVDVMLTANQGIGFFFGAGAEPFTTQTDTRGEFRFSGIGAGAYDLTAGLDGFAPGRRQVPGVPAQGELVLEDLVLTPGARLYGRVVDPSGRAVEGAEFFPAPSANPFDFTASDLTSLFAAEPLARSGAGGEFAIERMAAGPFRLRVSSADHPDRIVEGNADQPGVRQGPILVELNRGASILGTVAGIPEARRSELRVSAQASGQPGFPGFGGAFGERSAPIDAQGRFEIAGLDPNASYRVRVTPAGDGPRSFARGRTLSNSVNAQAGERGVALTYREDASLTFRVLGPDGEPVERFRARWELGGFPGDVGASASAPDMHPGGLGRLEGLNLWGNRAGTLVIDAPGHRVLRVDDLRPQAGSALELGDLRLERAAEVLVRVIDGPEGGPVAGARVRVAPAVELAAGMTGAGRGGRGFGRAMNAGRALMGAGEAPGTRSAATDVEGIARLESPGSGALDLTVDAPGFALLELEGARPDSEGVLVARLERAARATVRVVNSAGAPLAGVRVLHRAPGAEEAPFMQVMGGMLDTTVTDGAGELRFERLEPGLHGFRAERATSAGPASFVFSFAGGQAPEWTELNVAPGRDAELVLVLADPARLVGTVREGGRPLAGAELRLAPAEEGRGEMRGMMAFGGGSERGRTDGSGRFELEQEEAGVYTLSVSHPTRAMASSFPVTLERGTQRFDVDLAVTAVEGRVVDGAGRPLAGIQVEVRRAGRDGRGQGGRDGFRGRSMIMTMAASPGGEAQVLQLGGESEAGRTDGDGRFRLVGVPEDTDLRVHARGAGFQPAESEVFRVALDQVRSGLRFVLQPGAELEVAIEGELRDASGVPMVMVQLRPADPAEGGPAEGSETPGSQFTQAPGMAQFQGVAPGRWTIEVRPLGRSTMSDTPALVTREVELEAGRSESVRLRLP